MIKKTVIAAVFVFFFLSCVSAPGQGNTDVRHEVIKTNEGTRSEGEWGLLYIRGRQLPGLFSVVHAGGKKYSFIAREHPWSRGAFNECRKGTPGGWIHIEREDMMRTPVQAAPKARG